jgi:hypothetical protein
MAMKRIVKINNSWTELFKYDLSMTRGPFVESVDQGQTAWTLQSDLGYILSEKEIYFSKRNFEIATFGFLVYT